MVHVIEAPTVPKRCMARHVLVITGSTLHAELPSWLNELQPNAVVHTSDLSANDSAGQFARELGLMDQHHPLPQTPEWVCQGTDKAALDLLPDFPDIQEVHNFAPFCAIQNAGSVHAHLYRLFVERGIPVYHH